MNLYIPVLALIVTVELVRVPDSIAFTMKKKKERKKEMLTSTMRNCVLEPAQKKDCIP
jgi:hypothetical protein